MSNFWDDRSFVTAIKHYLSYFNVLAMKVILNIRPDALFIQSEFSEYFHPANPIAVM